MEWALYLRKQVPGCSIKLPGLVKTMFLFFTFFTKIPVLNWIGIFCVLRSIVLIIPFLHEMRHTFAPEQLRTSFNHCHIFVYRNLNRVCKEPLIYKIECTWIQINILEIRKLNREIVLKRYCGQCNLVHIDL